MLYSVICMGFVESVTREQIISSRIFYKESYLNEKYFLSIFEFMNISKECITSVLDSFKALNNSELSSNV